VPALAIIRATHDQAGYLIRIERAHPVQIKRAQYDFNRAAKTA